MPLDRTRRRTFLKAVGLSATPLLLPVGRATAAPAEEIIDTHQHLWDPSRLELPWLESAPELLRRSYLAKDYAAASEGLPIRAIYMEVDVADSALDAEATEIRRLCAAGTTQTCAAIMGGRPDSDTFEKYLERHVEGGAIKGVRRVLHVPATPRGFCLEQAFQRGIRTLGTMGLTFDLCMRPTELEDAEKLAAACPETRLILDHCGNGDAKAFMRAPPAKPAHAAADWQRAIERLAKKPNVSCKISGVVESLPGGWTTEDLAPVVNHCLDAFGPDRVVFGSNWPVCLIGSSLHRWVAALADIVAGRPAADRAKLWASNARRIYRLTEVASRKLPAAAATP